jgi:two-component system, chemotaxis family, sensor kinase CheA
LSDVAESGGLKEFVSAYVVEAEEHLETASTQLLAIEQALRSGGANLRALREAFRALHTIKGLSAMVGVEPVVTIAHRMEALLRASDRRGAKLPIESIDVLLRGVRAIQSRVRAFGEGKAVSLPDGELLHALDALDTEHGSEIDELPLLDLEPSLAAKLGALELEQLKTGLNDGQRALRVDFKPSLERSARGVTINQVREQLQRIGDVVKVFPTSQAPGPTELGGLSFVIILLSPAPLKAVADAADVEEDKVQVLAEIPARRLPVPDSEEALVAEEPLDAGSEDLHVPQRGVVRVDVSRLDDTVEGLSALLVTRFRLARSVKALRDRGVDTRDLEAIVNDNARQLRSLRAAILRVRMVPVSELLERIPLIVRGLRRTMNRQVRLELEAGGAEVDKAVAERLFPALVHLIRNAVDHAIETPDERARRGKPEDGLIRIECSSRSNRWLEMRISDDGRGIDPTAVARRAGAVVPATEAGLLELICRSGLSTRDVATTTSGRGMGMEIVKRIVHEQLGGELTLHTELGRGTTFKLMVPLSISVVDAFSFVCGGQRFVTPVVTVEEIIEIDPREVVEGVALPGQRPVRLVRRRGRAVPLLSLASVFAMPVAGPEAKALVVRRGDDTMAFAIERMLGQQEVVVRPLNDSLIKVPGVSGATDLGDGQPTLVLDLLSLGASVSSRKMVLNA